MQKVKKITALTSILIILTVFLYWCLPFVLVLKSFNQVNKQKELALLNNAVKISIFAPQKQYALESAIPALVITRDYFGAIEYIKELEKYKPLDNSIKYLASYSYMQIGDLENAMQYAIESGNKKIQTRIYNKIKEKRK